MTSACTCAFCFDPIGPTIVQLLGQELQIETFNFVKLTIMNSNTIQLNQTMLDLFDKSNRDYIVASLWVNICYIVIGFVGSIFCALTIIVILNTKELRNSSHYIIASQAIVSASVLLVCLPNGVAKCALQLTPTSIVHTRRYCLFTKLIAIAVCTESYFVSIFFLRFRSVFGLLFPRFLLREPGQARVYSPFATCIFENSLPPVGDARSARSNHPGEAF